jgi:hypothetical protein
MDAVRAVLVADPVCLLWRNELGATSHYPDGMPRRHPIRYGVCNPGGADLLGLYGPRFLAVECKTVRGSQSGPQVDFERWITSRGGVYALVRSEPDAAELLSWLRTSTGAAACELPEHLRGEGGQSTPKVQYP